MTSSPAGMTRNTDVTLAVKVTDWPTHDGDPVVVTLQAKRGMEAAAEFQKIVDHRGIVPTTPEHSLAKLGLGSAYVLAGDTAKAKAAYPDFFALWKDADPDVPILKEAKSEYQKLQ